MRKKLLACVVVVCITEILLIPVYATNESTSESNYNRMSVTEQKEVLENLTEDNIEKIMPNSHGERNVENILNQKDVNDKFLEKISTEGEVEVEQLDAKNIEVTIDINEPTSTIIYDTDGKFFVAANVLTGKMDMANNTDSISVNSFLLFITNNRFSNMITPFGYQEVYMPKYKEDF